MLLTFSVILWYNPNMDMREFAETVSIGVIGAGIAEGFINGISPATVGITATGLIGAGLTYFVGRKEKQQDDEQEKTQNNEQDNERFL